MGSSDDSGVDGNILERLGLFLGSLRLFVGFGAMWKIVVVREGSVDVLDELV